MSTIAKRSLQLLCVLNLGNTLGREFLVVTDLVVSEADVDAEIEQCPDGGCHDQHYDADNRD
ncbi:MAG: hypothetical protein R3C28_25985 [Pirellulaceae bacterium]